MKHLNKYEAKKHRVISSFLFANSFGVPILKLEEILLSYKKYYDWDLITAKIEIELSDWVDTDKQFHKCLIGIDKIFYGIRQNFEGRLKWRNCLNKLKIIPKNT